MKNRDSASSKEAPKRKRSWARRAFYFAIRLICQYIAVLLFGLRAFGRENISQTGGALILSTHQSHFDPVLIGVTFNEHLNYLARRSLFKNRLFGALIGLLDAIELDRDRSGLAGLKETIKRLRKGEKVLVFPEGTRTPDGRVGELKPGFISVARRTKVPLIPVAITGAFEALPRGSKIPLRVPLRVAIGQVIRPDDLENLTDDELLRVVSGHLKMCDSRARAQS